MIKMIYSIHDNKTGCFLDTFNDTHDESAKRAFTEACSDPKSRLNRFPNDFDLYRLGTFDTSSGRVLSADVPEKITSAIHCLPKGV